jgi:hypothetical protein
LFIIGSIVSWTWLSPSAAPLTPSPSRPMAPSSEWQACHTRLGAQTTNHEQFRAHAAFDVVAWFLACKASSIPFRGPFQQRTGRADAHYYSHMDVLSRSNSIHKIHYDPSLLSSSEGMLLRFKTPSPPKALCISAPLPKSLSTTGATTSSYPSGLRRLASSFLRALRLIIVVQGAERSFCGGQSAYRHAS